MTGYGKSSILFSIRNRNSVRMKQGQYGNMKQKTKLYFIVKRKKQRKRSKRGLTASVIPIQKGRIELELELELGKEAEKQKRKEIGFV